jgi:hypothetical protein
LIFSTNWQLQLSLIAKGIISGMLIMLFSLYWLIQWSLFIKKTTDPISGILDVSCVS